VEIIRAPRDGLIPGQRGRQRGDGARELQEPPHRCEQPLKSGSPGLPVEIEFAGAALNLQRFLYAFLSNSHALMARCRLYRVIEISFRFEFPAIDRCFMCLLLCTSTRSRCLRRVPRSFRARELYFTSVSAQPAGEINVEFSGAFRSSRPFHSRRARSSLILPAIIDPASSDRERSRAISRPRESRGIPGEDLGACARDVRVAFARFPWNCTCIVALALSLIDRTMHRSPSLSLSATLGFHCDPSACNEGLRTVVALI
jgi:hypothetical protein